MKIKKSRKAVQNANEFKIGGLYIFRNRASDSGYFSSGNGSPTEKLVKNDSILLFVGSEITQSDIGRIPAVITTKFLFENKILSIKVYVDTHEYENFLFYKVIDDFG